MRISEPPDQAPGQRHLPAARLLSTARLVYSEAHTLDTAVPRAPGSDAGMPAMDSYSPAPDMPARSSTLADDLAMSIASAGKPLPAKHARLQSAPAFSSNPRPAAMQYCGTASRHMLMCRSTLLESYLKPLIE